jgi:hypothetical protein
MMDKAGAVPRVLTVLPLQVFDNQIAETTKEQTEITPANPII